MKRTTSFAIAFVSLASLVATSAVAADHDATSREGKMIARLKKADKDKSGGISLDEFTAAMNKRFDAADTNHDGKVTVAELAARMEKLHYQRMARRFIRRFDTNGDDVLTKDEVDGRQKKLFALLDRNNDGKIEMNEIPRHRWGKHGRHHHRKDGDTPE